MMIKTEKRGSNVPFLATLIFFGAALVTLSMMISIGMVSPIPLLTGHMPIRLAAAQTKDER